MSRLLDSRFHGNDGKLQHLVIPVKPVLDLIGERESSKAVIAACFGFDGFRFRQDEIDICFEV
jgi:hypothetical protein